MNRQSYRATIYSMAESSENFGGSKGRYEQCDPLWKNECNSR